MIYLQLFIVFLKIGILGFGGGYAMLSLMQFEIVERYAWIDASEFADMVALSQMTPGPISINAATYTGFIIGGVFGSLLATFALMLPSIIIMLIITHFITKQRNSFIIDKTLEYLKPVVAGLILSAAIIMMTPENFCDFGLNQNNISTIICIISFIAVFFLKINPIYLIIISGVAGYFVFK